MRIFLFRFLKAISPELRAYPTVSWESATNSRESLSTVRRTFNTSHPDGYDLFLYLPNQS